jgi:hypothetical protein
MGSSTAEARIESRDDTAFSFLNGITGSGVSTDSTFLSGFPSLFVWFKSWKFFPFALVFERGIPEKAGGGVVWMVALIFFNRHIPFGL